jgi:transketolase
MVQNAVKFADDLSKIGKKVGIIDVHAIPTGEQALLTEIAKAKVIFTLEEHFLPGGFGSYILELMNDNNVSVPVKRFGLGHDRGYCYKYGGRDDIHEYYGVDVASVKKAVRALLKK